MTELKDQNTTVHKYVYDQLGRLLHDKATAFGTDTERTVKRISRGREKVSGTVS